MYLYVKIKEDEALNILYDSVAAGFLFSWTGEPHRIHSNEHCPDARTTLLQNQELIILNSVLNPVF